MVSGGDRNALVGRQREVAELSGFLDALPGGPGVMMLEGDPGIGKTTLWQRGTASARERSYRLLDARGHEAEAKLSFTTLGDLFDGVDGEALAAVPAPQRRALDAALLRIEPEEAPLRQRAVGVAVLAVLRALSQQQPLVVAIDDAQWMDSASEAVLTFPFRRLHQEPVGLLITVRSPVPPRLLGLDRTHLPIAREALAPFTLGALGRVVTPVYGGPPPRSLLIKIHRASGGNPLFAIEIAREVRRRPDSADQGETHPLPLPRHLRQLLRERVAELSTNARRSLLAVAALASADRPTVERMPGGAEGVGEAIRAGVLTANGSRLEPHHPLIGSVVYEDATPDERRAVHGRLAVLVTDVEEHARHLALATVGADRDVAAALEQAATTARGRGAPDAAAELSEHAARLTPDGDEARRRARLVHAADHWFTAGDAQRARSLLESAVEDMPPGDDRATILWRLARVRYTSDSMTDAIALFEAALAEAEDDALRAWIEQALAFAAPVTGDFASGAAHARTALTLASRVDDPAVLALALCRVASTEFLLGAGLDTTAFSRAVELEQHVPNDLPVEWLPSFIYANCRIYADDLDGARGLFATLHDRAVGQGDDGSLPPLLFLMSQLECLAGNWPLADQHATQGLETARQAGQDQVTAHALFARCLVDAHLGRLDAARAAAAEGMAAAQRTGIVAPIGQITAVLGFIELSVGDPASAHRLLAPLGAMLREMGAWEPGVFRFMADEIEALITLGEADEATALLDQLETRGQALDRASALASAGRCRGLLLAAQGNPEEAATAFAAALEHHGRLAMPFELARTLLAQGQVARRAKRWADARRSLEASLEVFEDLGAARWAERARAELGRVGGRRRATQELSATERRVAELVASGMSNPEVANALFLTRKSVEANLTKIYRKVGVRSRTQLAAKLAGERLHQ